MMAMVRLPPSLVRPSLTSSTVNEATSANMAEIFSATCGVRILVSTYTRLSAPGTSTTTTSLRGPAGGGSEGGDGIKGGSGGTGGGEGGGGVGGGDGSGGNCGGSKGNGDGGDHGGKPGGGHGFLMQTLASISGSVVNASHFKPYSWSEL